jgi:hypothetical protein
MQGAVVKVLPPRYADWSAFRWFHRSVWGRTLSRSWPDLASTAVFAVAAWADFRPPSAVWVAVLMLVCGALTLVRFGASLGRHYLMLESHIRAEQGWRASLQDLRQRMLDDGVPVEEADQALWQLEMDLERQRRGGS